MIPIQYDLFEDIDVNYEIKQEQEGIKDSLRRTQKRFFAQNNELMLMIIKQQREIDELNNRITRLIKIKG